MKKRSLKDLFHLIKKVLPEEQDLYTFAPETLVDDALSIMDEKNISQVPVVSGKEVLGVFSFRSFSLGIQKLPNKKENLLGLNVEEFLEKLKFAHISDDLAYLINEIDAKDAVLIGSPNKIQGIVSAIDALQYFYKVANPYILLLEIELAIRELIRESVDNDQLNYCISQSLKKHYENMKQKLPDTLEDMSLHDYVEIITLNKTWGNFNVAFGKNRNLVNSKLRKLPKLRNDVFHFKRELTIDEYDSLRAIREWLLTRIKRVEGSKENC